MEFGAIYGNNCAGCHGQDGRGGAAIALASGRVLAFLLFEGSLHVDLATLRSRALPVFLLAVFGTIISTGVVAVLIWGAPTWPASTSPSHGHWCSGL